MSRLEPEQTTDPGPLDGRQKKALHAALLSAFPRQAALERLVEFQLDTRLSVIAGEGPLADVAYRLIEWAQAHGRLDALITGAREANPNNPQLLAFDALLREPRRSRPIVSMVSGRRPGCTIAISIALVAAFVIPLAWVARQAGDSGGPPASQAHETRPKQVDRPGRRVEIEIAFRWEPRPQASGCRSDEQWQRLLFAGTSLGEWPTDSNGSREVQLVSLVDGIAIDSADVFAPGGQVAEAVATGRPRHLVRKWRLPADVGTPLRIAACLQARGQRPSPALRATTWSRAGRAGSQGG